jgi:transcriptional regulator with XRE-family HTH domain
MNHTEQQFLTSDQLAERYGLSPATIADWRRKNRGPEYYTLPKYAVASGSAKVRYELNKILKWEKENNITPKNPF